MKYVVKVICFHSFAKISSFQAVIKLVIKIVLFQSANLTMLYHVVLLCFAVIQASVAYSPWNYNGTTPNLESIVKGRCTEYQVLNLDNRDPEFQVKVDCNVLWDTFTSAFKSRDPCKTNFTNAYNETFALIENNKPYTNNVRSKYNKYVISFKTFSPNGFNFQRIYFCKLAYSDLFDFFQKIWSREKEGNLSRQQTGTSNKTADCFYDVFYFYFFDFRVNSISLKGISVF